MKKRLVSLLLAFSMMLTFLPVGAVSAFAEDDGTFSDGTLNYTVIDEGAKTAKVSGVVNADTLTEADIPAECKGYKITEIGKEAFKGCAALQSVTIGANVEKIDDYAFKDSVSYWNTCKALATVTFAPGSCLKEIGEGAFKRCTALESITIGANVEKIGKEAFYDDSALATVKFAPGSGLKTIGDSAFGSTAITAIDLPETLETIGEGALAYTQLTKIVIPAKVENLGSGAFVGCENLEKVEFKGDKLKTIEMGMFQDCTKLTEVQWPTDLQKIEEAVFSGCSALEELDFRDLKELKEIGAAQTLLCLNLKKVYLPANASMDLDRSMVAEPIPPLANMKKVTIYYAGSEQDFKDRVSNGSNPQNYFYKVSFYGQNDESADFWPVEFSEYTVTFENEDGSVVYAKRALFAGDTFSAVKKPADPTKAGYTFKGWKLKDSGEMFEDIASDTVLDASMTFVPVWEENKAPAKSYRIVVENGTVNGNTGTAEVDAGEPVTLKPGEAPDGMSFQYWDIPQELMDALTAHSEGKFDNKNPDLTFPMPTVKAGEYTIKAMFGTPDTVDDTDYTALGIATGVVGGTVVAGILGWQAYSLASQSYLELFLPYIPTNRAELATLLWEDAGKPETAAEAYADIDTDKTELQEAAHWAVAEGLMDEADPEDEHVFAPNSGISNWTIIKAWHKAQKLKKG